MVVDVGPGLVVAPARPTPPPVGVVVATPLEEAAGPLVEAPEPVATEADEALGDTPGFEPDPAAIVVGGETAPGTVEDVWEVIGADVVDVTTDAAGDVLVARTAEGGKGGCPLVPATLVAPYSHISTLPGGGRYSIAPWRLYVQLSWPGSACQ
jgi:hypothetical protein